MNFAVSDYNSQKILCDGLSDFIFAWNELIMKYRAYVDFSTFVLYLVHLDYIESLFPPLL